MHFIFDRNNLVEINEWLHESYLHNNEDIHNLKIQNEELLDRLQDSCSYSYVSHCLMVYCSEDYHDMMELERHEKMQVLDVFEDYIDEIQSLFVVEEELELPLENGYTLFEEVHDSTTWNQPMRKFFNFEGRLLILPLCILHMMKMFYFLIIWVSWFFLLHPTLPNFAVFILMKYS